MKLLGTHVALTLALVVGSLTYIACTGEPPDVPEDTAFVDDGGASDAGGMTGDVAPDAPLSGV